MTARAAVQKIAAVKTIGVIQSSALARVILMLAFGKKASIIGGETTQGFVHIRFQGWTTSFSLGKTA
jgi:hypothetical protein